MKAMDYFGMLFRDRQGVSTDYRKTMAWFVETAGKEHVHGENSIGTQYKLGKDAPVDYIKALELFHKSAQEGMLEPSTTWNDDPPLEKVQAVRSVTKSNVNTATPYTPAEIVHIDCHTDPITLEDVVLWGDILQAFDDALHIRHKSRVVPFLKGPDLKPIAAIKDEVLDVVIADPVTRPEASTMQETPVVIPQSPPPEGPSQGNTAIRRNPVYGLVETALENYTHIDNPLTSQPLRGPQTQNGDQQDNDNKPQETSPSNTDRRLQAPQDHTAAPDAMDITQTMVNASLGNTYAQVALGKMYVRGQGVNQDYQAAMDWFCKAAEKSDPVAQNEIGDLFRFGNGVPQDCLVAMEWYDKAARQDDPRAQYNIAQLYDYGLGVSLDHGKAMHWYCKAAEKGYAPAQSCIGGLYANGQGVARDSAKSQEWYLKAAAQHNAEAEFRIGTMYRQGNGHQPDESTALYWFNRAIEHGDTNGWGFYTKGCIHLFGVGVPKDSAKAHGWFLKAAWQGNIFAQGEVGILYYEGNGTPKDYSKAMEWLIKAASQGIGGPQHVIGSMYYQGLGVPQNQTVAFEWFLKAAQQNYAPAQRDVGMMYLHGLGVTQDDTKAMPWFSKAAEQGFADAQHELGHMYYVGNGVAKDVQRAKSWFLRASDQGHAMASKYLQHIQQVEES
ncbi:hypothetical protein BGZ89_000367 [Linnemannia elongata]|nr:hypothetical protein BGZ89_000367 [Linnemannia elongata]